MPKLPPPPRSPQNRSGCSWSLAVRNRPSAVTTSADSRLSQVSPYLRCSQPMPPPSVSPAIPVVETAPPVVASPNACVSRSNSPQVRPAWAWARPGAGVDPHALHRRQVDDDAVVADRLPGDVVPAAADRDRQVRARCRTASAASTSATPVQRAITAGRLSIMPLCTLRAVSYSGSAGPIT